MTSTTHIPLEGAWSSPFERRQRPTAELRPPRRGPKGRMPKQAVIDATADGDPARVRAASRRFLRPIRPATALRIEVYRTADGARFEARDPDAKTVLAGAATTA